MKRFLSLIVVCFFLFISITPVFSFAAGIAGYTVNSVLRYSYAAHPSYQASWIVSQDEDHAYLFCIMIDNLLGETVQDVRLYFDDDAMPGYPGFAVKVSNNISHLNSDFYTVQWSTVNLLTGQSLTSTSQKSFNGNYVYFTSNRTIIDNQYLEWNCYAIPELEFSNTSTTSFHFATVVDPFVIWSVPPISQRSISSYLNEPHADNCHFYLADHKYLYAFVYENGVQYIDDQDNHYYPGIIPYIVGGNPVNNVTIRFYNLGDQTDKIHLFIYSILDGSFVSYQSKQKSPADPAVNFNLTLDDPSGYGIWFDGLFPINNTYIYPFLPISWSDTINYTSDLYYISTLLQQIDNKLSLIDQDINTLLVGLTTVCSNFLTYYQSTFTNVISPSWTDLLEKVAWIYQLTLGITQQNSSFIIPYLSGIKDSLDNIEDYLIGHTETEPDTSAFQDNISEYEEGESYIVNQAEVALDDFESQLSGASDVLSVNSRGLLFVKNIFETFAFSGLNYYYILFVLVLGSVALLIGRKLR